MNKWLVLGMDETKDVNEIKECYLSKLEKVHPEEDPEGFKLLRNAYEEALKFAKEDNLEEGNSVVDKWIEEVRNTYNTFSLRINEEIWKELLDDPISFSLEYREEVLEKLLAFLMESYYLPQKIWALFDKHFSIIEIKDDLYEVFPREFIDFVTNSIKYDGIINYDLFEIDDSKNYEGWISLYNKINRELNDSEGSIEDIKSQLEELSTFKINHPYEKILNARYYIKIEDTESAREICDSLHEEYKNDVALLYCMAEIEWINKNYSEAEKFYLKCLEINSDNSNFKMGLADVLLEQGKAKEAKEIYSELVTTNPYDGYLRYRLETANEKIIEEAKAKGIKQCNDIKELFNLAWCYYENSRYKESINIVKKIVPESTDDRRQQYDIFGRCYSALNDYEKALKYFQLWLDDELNGDEDEDKDDKKKRISYVYNSKGKEFFCLKKYDEALQCYEEALKIEEDSVRYIINKCEVLNKLRRYEESLELSDRALNIDNSVVSIYLYRAEAMFKLNYYSDALECCDVAISIFPYFKDIYILKGKIYSQCEEYEKVLEVIKQCDEYEFEDDEILLYKAIALMHLDQFEKGYEILEKLKESNSDDVQSKAYYEIAMVEHYKEEYDEALRNVNTAIELNNTSVSNYYLRAAIFTEKEMYDLAVEDYRCIIKNNGNEEFMYYKMGCVYGKARDIDEAMKCFHKVIDINPENFYANGELAKLYSIKEDEDKALYYVTKQLQVNPNEYYYLFRGLMYEDRDNMNDAEADYNKALEINPGSCYAYNHIGYLYQERGDFNTAIEYYKKSISCIGDDTFVLAYNNIADSYMYLKNYEMALQYLDEGIKNMPKEQSLFYNKGKALRLMGRYDEAIQILKQGYIMHGADKEDYYNEIACTYRWMNKERKAIRWYKKVLMMNNRNHCAISSIGDIYKKMKRYRKAKIYYSKFFEIGEDISYYIYLADMYKDMNKLDRAKMYYETAIKKCEKEDLEDARKFSDIGYCYKQLGNIDEAIKYLNKSIEANPCNECKGKGCHSSYNRFGELYESEGNYELALKYYRKASEIDDDIKYLEDVERIEKIISEN